MRTRKKSARKEEKKGKRRRETNPQAFCPSPLPKLLLAASALSFDRQTNQPASAAEKSKKMETKKNCGAAGDRTRDLLDANETRYHCATAPTADNSTASTVYKHSCNSLFCRLALFGAHVGIGGPGWRCTCVRLSFAWQRTHSWRVLLLSLRRQWLGACDSYHPTFHFFFFSPTRPCSFFASSHDRFRTVQRR